jgi:flagellar hook-associated protein 2
MRAAADAKINIGSAAGQEIVQASNTFTVVDGVSVTFTKAQGVGDTPVDITVGRDNDGTAANLQSFIDSYNAVVKLLKDLTGKPGSGNTNKNAGVFASDAGIVALRARMQDVLRTASGGKSLVNFGVTAQRDGTLALDKTKMEKAISLDATQLDAILGGFTAPSGGTGVLGGMRALLYGWTALSRKVGVDPITNADIFAPGTLTQRTDAIGRMQKTTTDRQAALDRQYEAAYQRYLKQFSQLQQLQSQLTGTSSMFDAMFSSDKS